MLKILRWEGGYAGDSILASVLSANKQLLSNVIYESIADTGQATTINDSQHILYELRTSKANTVDDPIATAKKIDQVINDTQTHIIGTHCYDSFLDDYSDYITDIESTNDLLSFTCAAVFYKLYSDHCRYMRETNKFYRILEQKDKVEADRYAIHQLAVTHYMHNAVEHKSKNKILLDNWINLQYNSILGYDFDIDIYNKWREQNKYMINNPDSDIEKICNLVKQEVPYKEIRKQLI